MARPTKCRRICEMPKNCEFAPVGGEFGCVEITLDELETLRLIDHLGLSQQLCASQMQVARTTVQSIYDGARKKVAEALIEGKRIKICGGSYEVCPMAKSCCQKQCRDRSCDSGCKNFSHRCGCQEAK